MLCHCNGLTFCQHNLVRLAAKPAHWFVVLHAITDASPVAPENCGRLKEMTAAWLKWGKLNGYA